MILRALLQHLLFRFKKRFRLFFMGTVSTRTIKQSKSSYQSDGNSVKSEQTEYPTHNPNYFNYIPFLLLQNKTTVSVF
jgi:hypothetical protein